MEARTDARFRDQIVVGYACPDALVDRRGVNSKIHPLSDLHGFVQSDKRPLHEVISLAVGIKPPVRKITVFFKERIVGIKNIFRTGPRFQQAEGQCLGFQGNPVLTRYKIRPDH